MGRLRKLLGARFRANPEFELAAAGTAGALSWSDSEVPSAALSLAAVLRPSRLRWLGARALDSDTAELILALGSPGPIPTAFTQRLDGQADRELARLVMDGVLEVEHDGGFVFGGEAHAVLFDPPTPSRNPPGALARLSVEAVEYGARLPISDVERLAARLYFYHRRPATPGWLRRLPDVPATARFLRVHSGTPTRNNLERYWQNDGEARASDDFSHWWPREIATPDRPDGHVYKLFISPEPEQVPEVLARLIKVLVTFGAAPPPLKFGCGSYSLLRPDKIVVYFTRMEELLDCAAQLADLFTSAPPPVHGVPFSAELEGNGLLSWGIDPPAGFTRQHWRGMESWRRWVTARLARSLLIARQARAPAVDPVRFALDRMTVEGVNVETWAPSESHWP